MIAAFDTSAMRFLSSFLDGLWFSLSKPVWLKIMTVMVVQEVFAVLFLAPYIGVSRHLLCSFLLPM